jgi:uncharacterized membrane protein (DUF485 family)
MEENNKDWAALAKMPKFVELHSKKRAFLITLWFLGSVMFYLLPICAGYAPELMKIKIFGRLNVCYFFCMLEFVMIWGIAAYYTHKSNTYFDPLTEEVLAEIEGVEQ